MAPLPSPPSSECPQIIPLRLHGAQGTGVIEMTLAQQNIMADNRYSQMEEVKLGNTRSSIQCPLPFTHLD